MERRVGPADCVLAVALPLTWTEFADDAGSPQRDFARSMVRGSGRAIRQAWEEVYEPRVVRTCERVVEHVASLGGAVRLGVTAGALKELIASFPVVCLVAHLASSRIESGDIVDPDRALRIISGGDSIVARHLRMKLGEGPPDLGGNPRQALAALFEAVLEPTRVWFASTVRHDHHRCPAPILSRPMLEDCFGAALRRAPVLELCDDLHTARDLVDMIPDAYDGVLDLSVCNSVALGESIKRWRRSCLVIENAYLARIDLRLARYALAMTMLARRPGLYTDTLRELSLELMKA